MISFNSFFIFFFQFFEWFLNFCYSYNDDKWIRDHVKGLAKGLFWSIESKTEAASWFPVWIDFWKFWFQHDPKTIYMHIILLNLMRKGRIKSIWSLKRKHTVLNELIIWNHQKKTTISSNDENGYRFIWNSLCPYKEGCIFPMVISSEFRLAQYWDDDHREDAFQFTLIAY